MRRSGRKVSSQLAAVLKVGLFEVILEQGPHRHSETVGGSTLGFADVLQGVGQIQNIQRRDCHADHLKRSVSI